MTAQVQYTTGVGVGGGALVDGVKGALFKGWTVTSQLTTGSGLPFTPVYLAPGSGDRRDRVAASEPDRRDARRPPTGTI